MIKEMVGAVVYISTSLMLHHNNKREREKYKTHSAQEPESHV